MWPWLFRFDRPKLAGYRAAAEAKLGRWRAAEESLAVAAKASQSPKQHAVMQIEHAHVLAGRSQVDQACSVALAALETGRTYGSERVLRAVAVFRSSLGSGVGKVAADLDEQLHSVYTDDL